MSRHTPYSTLCEITLTGIGEDSVMHKGVQTAYACARAFKNCVCCRERALRRYHCSVSRLTVYECARNMSYGRSTWLAPQPVDPDHRYRYWNSSPAPGAPQRGRVMLPRCFQVGRGRTLAIFRKIL